MGLISKQGLLSTLGQVDVIPVPMDKSPDEDSDEQTYTRQVQIRLTKAEVDELVKARQGGALIKELAEQFGIHRTTVMAHLKRHY